MKLIKFIKYNFLNVFRYSLFNKNISIRRPQRIDRSVKILTSNGGKIEIGKGCHFLRNTTVQSDSGHISIGNGTFINENAKIVSHKKITIGERCSFGPNVVIYDHDHDYKNARGTYVSDEIVIGNNVWIGANAVILKNSVIEDNCVIAAGTVVKGHIPSNTLAFNPKELEMRTIKLN